MASPEVLHVSRALREHGLVHFSEAPEDEYDCCAEVAINAFKEYRRIMRLERDDNTVVSSLLN